MRDLHELPDGPNLPFDPHVLAPLLAAVRLRQGRLLGRIAAVGRAPAGLALIDERELQLHALTHEVLSTSALDGERLSAEEVRSSVARHLGLPAGDATPAAAPVEGLVEILFDATRQYAAPLDTARLCAWHAALGPMRVGVWREGPTQVGPSEIARFLQWLEGSATLDPSSARASRSSGS